MLPFMLVLGYECVMDMPILCGLIVKISNYTYNLGDWVRLEIV